jgi:hypothetical protein
MAIRIRSSFHTGGKPRSMAELASVIAILGWKLAIDSIKRMREAEYDIDLGSVYFDFVVEFIRISVSAAALRPASRTPCRRRIASGPSIR